MRLGDRLLVRTDPEGRETYGLVIDILPHRVDLLSDDGDVVGVPYKHEDLTKRGPFPDRVLP